MSFIGPFAYPFPLSILKLISASYGSRYSFSKLSRGIEKTHVTAIDYVECLSNSFISFVLYAYDFNKKEAKLFLETADKEGIDHDKLGVPATFVDGQHFIGFQSDKTTGKQIESAIISFLEKNGEVQPVEAETNIITLPLLGEINPAEYSLPSLAIVLGFIDGFNPCAMWVLTFLLSILLYAKSRKKMLLIGSVFVLTSGLIYF